MTTTKKILMTLTCAGMLIASSVPAIAGSCGSSTKHTHAEEAMAPAIFPLAEQAGFNTLIAAVEAAGLTEVNAAVQVKRW